jgi:hypothetical protein
MLVCWSLHTLNVCNLGYVTTSVDRHALKPVLDEIAGVGATTPLKDHSHVGTITDEYVLTSSIDCLRDILGPMVEMYVKEHHFSIEPRGMTLLDAWVNLQQSGEYFSAHTHAGVFSFALWITVPFTQADERAWREARGKSGGETANFTFHYTDALGRITPYCIPVDSSYENTCILFPGEMMHSVTPYYSTDARRITVSGNIGYMD